MLFHCNNGCTQAPQCYVIHTLCVLQASILVESGGSATNITSNVHHKNGIFPATGYTNAAFVGSTTSLGVIASAATRPKPNRWINICVLYVTRILSKFQPYLLIRRRSYLLFCNWDIILCTKVETHKLNICGSVHHA